MEMKTMGEIDWAEMWRKSFEDSSWWQRAGIPEYWNERVDPFEDGGGRKTKIMS